ncbi:MAG: ABC transporter permease subunit [Chloroflexota bacterium]|nr:ABC transporter permease subunit [Chloroflexota bacterium]
MSTEHLTEVITEHQAIPFYRDERVLRWAAQILSAVVLIGLLVWVMVNFIQSANARGMALNFRFLNNPAGFPISDPVLPYDPSRTFGYAFLIGVVKTLLVSVIGIIFATILGTLIGLARLSSNWLLSRIALAYIEFHRNIPLLVLLFLWYFPVFAQFPPVEESITLAGPIYVNSRGIYFAWPKLGSGGVIWLVSIAIGIILAVIAWKVLEKRQLSTGKATYYAFVSLAIIIIVPTIGWFVAGSSPLVLDVPVLEGYNYQGGLRFTPEFAALLIGLTMYTAAFIAEVVRAGIQAVSKGQTEAARAVGLSPFQVISLIILPQALRVIIPPLISQYLNLTKNSSLALFIGYQEVFSVGKIAINQAGRAVPVFAMVMFTYLLMSLIVSWILNWYNRRIQFVEK